MGGNIQSIPTVFINEDTFGGGVGGPVAWADVTGKPTEFTPSAHSHAIADITGLMTALAGKADLVHTHVLSSITDAGTAASRNVPASGNASASQVVLGDDTRLSDARTPLAHTHSPSAITQDASNRFVTDAEKSTWNGKQDALVSGTNVKTVNGSSILGSGNLSVSAALSFAQTFATAETTISAATYADITGCSVTLAAGTWIIFAHVVARQPNAIFQAFVAITDSTNVVLAESAVSRPASGTASLNSPISCNFQTVVTPTGTVTYKLRAARGLTTHTGSYVVMDGNGVNTTNHASNNTDRGTCIIAVKIA